MGCLWLGFGEVADGAFEEADAGLESVEPFEEVA
jgi:hypothetical protein